MTNLNLGCGNDIKEKFTNVDCQKLEGVDVVHNLEKFPYPFENNSFTYIHASMILEHICPKNTIKFMNECWRLLKKDGTMFIAVPIAGSWISHQDPTHCNYIGEWTMKYFDPSQQEYSIYTPKPWDILEQDREIVRKEIGYGKLDIQIPIDCLEITLQKMEEL